MDEVSTHCKVVLEKGLDKETCYDFRKVRAYVMCLAWKKMTEKPMRFADAVREAWAETKMSCSRLSASI
jgi:hypothetical protein